MWGWESEERQRQRQERAGILEILLEDVVREDGRCAARRCNQTDVEEFKVGGVEFWAHAR